MWWPEEIPFEQRPKESEKGSYVMISGEPQAKGTVSAKGKRRPVFRGALYDSSRHEGFATM